MDFIYDINLLIATCILFVAMGKVLVIKVQIPTSWLKLVVIFDFFPTCKCCMLLNCIANLHVGTLKLEQMYKLGAYFYPLKCVNRNHKFVSINSKLFTNFLKLLL